MTTDDATHDTVRRMLAWDELDVRVDSVSLDLKASSPTIWVDGSSIGAEPIDKASDELDRAYHRYSQASHMGILDSRYKTFTSRRGWGSLLYTVRNRTLIVSGDPLCPPQHFVPLLKELGRFCRLNGWSMAFIGVSATFAQFARDRHWIAVQFGRERVVNPMTNKLLQNKGVGKRMASQNRQLQDPKRGGITLGIYAPGIYGTKPELESELQTMYDDWRAARNGKKHGRMQTFVTEFHLFSRRDLTLFIYAVDGQGRAQGFAALRSLGARDGFHLDPCIASASAPRGITDLLVVSVMKLLRGAGVSYLSLGFEPSPRLGDVPDKGSVAARLARDIYRRVVDSAQLEGKKTYNDKFRPDEQLSSDLYVVLPGGVMLPQQAVATLHVANIKIRRLLFREGGLKVRRKDGSHKERKTARAVVPKVLKSKG